MTRISPSFVICGEFESQEATVIPGPVDGHVRVNDAPHGAAAPRLLPKA
jgi:hypothetical protein